MMNYQSKPHLITFDERVELFDSYRTSKKRLLIFDYDGTLRAYCERPEKAVPSTNLKSLLVELNKQPENELIIISGRDASTLEAWFAETGLSLVAEHGAIIKRETSDWVSLIDHNINWKKDVEQIFTNIIANFQGSFLERKNYSLALHYRLVDPEKTEDLISELKWQLHLLDPRNFNLIEGNMVVEARSDNIDKGKIVSKILNEMNYDFVLAMGDDATDEDIFKVLADKKHYYTIKVGLTTTRAKCNFINVNNVLSFLQQLNQLKSITKSNPAG